MATKDCGRRIMQLMLILYMYSSISPGNHNCGRLPHPLRVEPGEPQERAEDGVALPGQLLHAVVQRAELPRGVREVDVRQHDRRQRQRG